MSEKGLETVNYASQVFFLGGGGGGAGIMLGQGGRVGNGTMFQASKYLSFSYKGGQYLKPTKL